jgi:multicomponent Na+:H+ antiporter subunit E
MMQVASKYLVLLVFWFFLSGQFDVTNSGELYLIACGIVSCAFVMFIAMRINILDEEMIPLPLMFRMIFYLPWLLREIFLANLDVAYRVWHPKRIIDPRIIKVPLDTRTDLGAVVYANSITLTPGTVTINVDQKKGEMLVHALSEKAARDLLSGEMHERVKKLEGSE